MGKSVVTVAREAAEARPLVWTRGREGGGCLWCASKGEQRREKNGARRHRATPFLNGAAGSRGREGGGSGSVAWRDMGKEGYGGGGLVPTSARRPDRP
jgi:hypothetical protein